jgi:hypothetical protein
VDGDEDIKNTGTDGVDAKVEENAARHLRKGNEKG